MDRLIFVKRFLFLLILLPMAIGIYANNTTYYSQAIAHAVPSAGGSVYAVKVDGKNKTAKGSSNVGTEEKSSQDNHYFCFTAEVNTGYSFGGWYTEATNGTKKSDNLQYTEDIDGNSSTNQSSPTTHNRYARFSAQTSTVNFFQDAGSTDNKLGSCTVTYDAKYNEATGWISTPTKTGYTFSGWYKNDGTTKVNSTDVVKITTNLALYAHWTANNYAITLNNHDATTAGSASISVTYNDSKNLTATPAITVPAKNDYTFGGYYTAENGGGSQIIAANGNVNASVSGYTDANKKWIYAGDVTLHAKWVLNSKTITLNNQSATTAGTTSIQVLYKKNNNLTGTPAITVPARTGYTFEGYYTATNGSGLQVIAKNGNVNASVSGYTDASKNWQYDNDVTLYAYWKQNQSITWNQNLDTPVRTAEITLTATSESGLSVYYTATSNNGTVSINGNKITCLTAGNVTVTAHQDGNASWNATSASKTFTIIEHAITKNPTATEITYEQILNNSNLSGGTANVEGTWAWKYPNSLPEAGTANQVAVFTPSSSIISGEPLECNVSVTVNKATPDVTCNIADNYMVDADALDLQSIWTREGNGQITYSRVSFTPSGSNNGGATMPAVTNNRYLSLGQAGTLRVQMAIAEGKNYNSRTVTKDLTIHKYNSTFDNVANITDVKVEASKSSSYTLTYTKPTSPASIVGTNNISNTGTPGLNSGSGDFYYTLAHEITTDAKTGCPEAYKDVVITYNAANKQATGRNKGTATVHLYQKETYKCNANDASFTVSVVKNANVIKVNGSASYTNTMFVDAYIGGLNLTSDNTDYTGCPITNTQTAGTKIATFYQKDKVVYSSYQLGTATWSLSQPENYKYNTGSGSFSIEVKKDAEGSCYTYTGPSGGKTADELIALGTIDLNGVGDVLTLQMHYNGTILGNEVNLHTSTDGSNWSGATKLGNLNASYADIDPISLPDGTRYIKFAKVSSDNPYLRNIKVTRKKYLNTSVNSITINKTSTNNPIYPSDGKGTGSFTVNYSITNGGDLKIACDNDKFTFSKDTINNVDCTTGSRTITVSYESDEAGTHVGHVVIYNDAFRKEITVTGVTAKRTQDIHWEVGNVVRLGSETEDAAWVITGNTVSYSSDHTNIINVVNGKLVALAVGTATITATADGNAEYNAASGTKTIEVTNDLIQTIVWDQDADLLRLKTGGSSLTLTAYATSDITGCTTNKARPISYTSGNESVVRVTNTNQLVIVGKGRTTLTATQDGSSADADGHKYMTVSETKTVVVRNPDDPCVNYLYEQGEEKKEDFGISLTNPQEKNVISLSNINEPETLTMKYKGEKKSWGVGNYYNGTMKVEEYYDKAWHVATNGDLGTPQENNYATFTTTLNRKTTQVRVRVYEGRGYHYVTEMKISQARYIEATSLNAFEAKVGQTVEQNLTVKYNNLVGPVSMTFGHTTTNFSVSEAYIDGDCGSKGSKTITVYYTPTSATSEETEVLKISDGVTDLNINLTGVAAVTNRQIVWNINDENSKYTVETVNLTAEARTVVGNSAAGDVFYSKGSLSTTGTLSGSTLTFENAGVAYIAAQCVSDDKYNMPTAVTKTFNVAITPTTITVAPTATDVISGTAVNAVTLIGGTAKNTVTNAEVAGTFSIKTGANLTDVQQGKSIAIHFEPSNTNMYSGCDGTMTLNVVQRDPEVSEIAQTTISAGSITYGEKLSDAVLSNSGSLAGIWAWLDSRKDNVENVGTYSNLQVRFTPTDTNIAPQDYEVSVSVTPATPELSWTAKPSSVTYGETATYVASSTSNEGAISYSISEGGEYASINGNTGELTVIEAGHTVTIQASQAASDNYNAPVAITTEVTLNQATPTGYSATASDIVANEEVSNSTITNTGVAGTWTWVNPSATYSIANTYNVAAIFTPDDANYKAVQATIALRVKSPTYTYNGDGNWTEHSKWSTQEAPSTPQDVIIMGDVIISTEVVVNSLTIAGEGSVTMVQNGKLTVNGASASQASYGDLVVKEDGEVVLNDVLKVNNFVIEAAQYTSGQVENPEHLDINGDAYIDITISDNATIDEKQWFGFTVPFPVSSTTGVQRINYATGEVENISYNTDYITGAYDSNRRANGSNGWRQYAGVLNPGTFYLLGVTTQAHIYRFHKTATGSLQSAAEMSLHTYNAADPANANWNAVGNPTLQYADASCPVNYVQIYNNNTGAYEVVDINDATFVVARPFFIQTGEGTLTLNAASGTKSAYYAPARRTAAAAVPFNVHFGTQTNSRIDQVFVSASDDADGTYTIGRDLAKAGTTTNVAQMMINACNHSLCVREEAWSGNTADFMLTLYTPKADVYTLSLNTVRMPNDGSELYLTENGSIIWNLSMSDYELPLGKGNHTQYGLRIIKGHGISTDAEDAVNDKLNGAEKIIMNNNLYILKDGVLFDATGKKVK